MMGELATYIRSLRVEVPLPHATIAAQLRGGIVCQCVDCQPLKHWLTDTKALCTEGSLSLPQCAIVIKQALGEYCDGCLAFAQMVNRRVGEILRTADGLTAEAAHLLDEAQAIERDRLASRRITLWFESCLACNVGAARARKLVMHVVKTPFTLSHLIETHDDEYGLTFDESLRSTVRHGASVYLEHYGHLVPD